MSSNEDDFVICSGDASEVKFAISKALEYAKKNFCVVWVYKWKGLFWLTVMTPERERRVAHVYPGGRIELAAAYAEAKK